MKHQRNDGKIIVTIRLAVKGLEFSLHRYLRKISRFWNNKPIPVQSEQMYYWASFDKLKAGLEKQTLLE